MTVGGTEPLFETITPNNATNQNVNWTSSNTDVATVSASGRVRAVSVGQARITVKTEDGNFRADCIVTVSTTDKPVTDVALNKWEMTIVVGGTETLFATITPNNATNQNVTWTSNNPSVATVSASGLVRAVSVGEARITVWTADGDYSDFCTVTVAMTAKPVTGVTLNKSETTIAVGDAEPLLAMIAPDNATNQNVTWTSDNTDVATVSASGLVRAVSAGTAHITVRTEDGGYTDFCTVTVIIPVGPPHDPSTDVSGSSCDAGLGAGALLFLAIAFAAKRARRKNK
jgi:uncharacterized protein YjdB